MVLLSVLTTIFESATLTGVADPGRVVEKYVRRNLNCSTGVGTLMLRYELIVGVYLLT